MAAKDKSHLPSIIVSALIATHIAALTSTSKPSGPFERITLVTLNSARDVTIRKRHQIGAAIKTSCKNETLIKSTKTAHLSVAAMDMTGQPRKRDTPPSPPMHDRSPF